MKKELVIHINEVDPSNAFPVTSNGHGYSAWLSVNNDNGGRGFQFMLDLLTSMSLGSGGNKDSATSIVSGDTYFLFELDARDHQFLRSGTFKRVCERYNYSLVIYEGYRQPELSAFYRDLKRRTC